MARPRKPQVGCSVDGCFRPAVARSWCSAHWERWRKYGSPLGGGTPKGALHDFVSRTILPYTDTVACLRWPYGMSSSGYGVMNWNGRREKVTRVVCEYFNGPAPSPAHQAAHSCGNGSGGCVSPHHLRWATPKENAADSARHGTLARGEKHGHHKLKVSDVLAIRAMLAAGEQNKEIAKLFQVSRIAISDIKRKTKWKWLDDECREITNMVGAVK